MKRIWAQVAKEWKQFRRDRLTVALSFLLPIVMLLLFGRALSLEVENLPMVVEDLDNTPQSRRYLETYLATNDFVLLPLPAGAALTDLIDAGQARFALRIPPHFGRDLLRGAPVDVQVLIDGEDSNTANVLRNTAQAVHRAFLLREPGRRVTPPRVQSQVRFWYNPGLSNTRFFGSGALGLVLVLFPALLGALAVSREHETGTMIQVYASTLSAPQWILGKAIPNILIGLAELAVCFLIGTVFLEYRLAGDPMPFLVGSFFYVAAGVFWGMAVGNVMRTQSASIQTVQLGAFLISMLLSGFLVPVSNAPLELRWVSYLLPATYYIEITRDSFLRGGGWGAVGAWVGVLAVMSVLAFAANARILRRMQFAD